MSEAQKPTDRLNYFGDIEPVIHKIVGAYDVGSVVNFSAIEVGYEDCNIAIQTDQGQFLAKMFAKTRRPEDINRYADIMEKVVTAGVKHPELMTTMEGKTVFSEQDISLVLMRFIEGKAFLELGHVPDKDDLDKILEQAAKINRIDYKPPYLFDSWAIPNIRRTYEKVRQFIQPSDLSLVEQAMTQYGAIPADSLPHAFVHGDFTKANILKANDGAIYVLDFSVANWYPRIQELAVIAANLLHDDHAQTPLRSRCKTVVEGYDQFNLLTSEEKRYLYPYALAGVAMEFLGAHKEKYINNNDTEETRYWLELGRSGLQDALAAS